MYNINTHQLMNVNDINLSFKSRNPNGMLLSDFSGSNAFWDEYKNNSVLYDKEFVRMFKNFVYYNQDYFENGVDITDDNEYSVATDFVEAVKMHLMKNDKKYSELYRVNIVDDKDNSITQNYNITEKTETTTTRSTTDTYGKRIDTDTLSKGERNDTTTLVKGAETSSTTGQVSPYDEETFYNASKQSDTLSERTDSQTVKNGAQTDITEKNKGEQIDSHVNSGGDVTTMTRNGNIGVKTVSQMLTEHTDFWKSWDFYNMIFQNICSDLLIIV